MIKETIIDVALVACGVFFTLVFACLACGRYDLPNKYQQANERIESKFAEELSKRAGTQGYSIKIVRE